MQTETTEIEIEIEIEEKAKQTLANNFIPDDIKGEEKDIESFIKAILSLELEIKSIRRDIVEIKKEAKSNKIPAKEINTAVRLALADLKKTPTELSEVEYIRELMDKSFDIKMLLDQIVRGE